MVAVIDSEWLFHNLGLKEGTVKDVEGTNIGNCFRITKGSKLVKNVVSHIMLLQTGSLPYNMSK